MIVSCDDPVLQRPRSEILLVNICMQKLMSLRLSSRVMFDRVVRILVLGLIPYIKL